MASGVDGEDFLGEDSLGGLVVLMLCLTVVLRVWRVGLLTMFIFSQIND